MRIASEFREVLMQNENPAGFNEHHIGATFEDNRFRVGKVIINNVSLVFHGVQSEIASELKRFVMEGKDMNSKEFAKWLRSIGKARGLEVYWGSGSIKSHPFKDYMTIKIHYVKPNGKRDDFIETFNLVEDRKKTDKVYELLQCETKEEADRVWEDRKEIV